MSDLLLGIASGAMLFGFYAIVLASQKSLPMRVVWAAVLVAGHAFCFAML